MKQVWLLVLAGLIGLLVVACGAKATPTLAPTPRPQQAPAATTVNADIANFTHQKLAVKVGASVVWTNKDSVGHTVTEKNGKFKSGVMEGGKTFTHLFNDVGNFDYACEIHPTMTATVSVTR